MERLHTLLHEREQAGLLRSLPAIEARREGRILHQGQSLLDFSGNDYLGLSHHPMLTEAAQRALKALGTGATASRLLSGGLSLHHELERRTAVFKGKPSALIFNSGYQANVGLIGCLCQRGDRVLCDRLSHASLLDGARLSGAKLERFRHNDVDHLGDLLAKSDGKGQRRLVVTESLFSMEGDLAPLRAIVALKERHEFELFVDEAHATGLFDGSGSGLAAQAGVTDRVDYLMGTFSKALGSFGGYVACSQAAKDYFINACGSFIYSTALPPAVIAANLAALKLVETEPQRRETLRRRADHFRRALRREGLEVLGASQIVPVILGDPAHCLSVSETLRDEGYWVLPIRPPTVPAGTARLRFSLTYWHGEDVLDALAHRLGRLCHV